MTDSDDKPPRSKGFIIFMRIMNAVTALILTGVGITAFILVSIKQFVALQFYLAGSPIFLMYIFLEKRLFGLMLFAADFNFKIINKFFPFLKNFLGIGFFNIYISTIVHYYFSCNNSINDIGWISASVIFGLGLFYCIMFCISTGMQSDNEETPQSKEKEKELEMKERLNDTKREIKDSTN